MAGSNETSGAKNSRRGHENKPADLRKGRANETDQETKAKSELDETHDSEAQTSASALNADDVSEPRADTAEDAPVLEKRLRDDPRYTGLVGEDIVPLSRRVSQVIWAFELIDALTATIALGKARVFAIFESQDGQRHKGETELATFYNRSGHLVAQTITTLSNDVPATRLVPAAGGILKGKVTKLRFENDLYDPKAIATPERAKLIRVVLSPAPRYPYPIAHEPNGHMAFILGHAPAVFDAGGVARLIIPPVTVAGSKSLIDRERRFALWVLAKKIFGDKPVLTVTLEIGDAPGRNRKLTLTYRATRDTSGEASDALPGADNTDRMKLTELVSLQPDGVLAIEAKDVPPVHLLLSSQR